MNINANELRIGNYVFEKITNIFCEVTSINHEGNLRLFCNGGSVGANVDEVAPIPLTEEILLKFGGKPLENGFWISVYNLKAELHFEVFNNTSEIVTTIKSQFSDLILDRIKYVHQLQNLYFALTNIELQIKLNHEKRNS